MEVFTWLHLLAQEPGDVSLRLSCSGIVIACKTLVGNQYNNKHQKNLVAVSDRGLRAGKCL